MPRSERVLARLDHSSKSRIVDFTFCVVNFVVFGMTFLLWVLIFVFCVVHFWRRLADEPLNPNEEACRVCTLEVAMGLNAIPKTS